LFGGKSLTETFLCFSVKVSTSHLLVVPYNDYQQFLYDKIVSLLKTRLNYKQIVDWLNDNNYKTVRGHNFRNNHTHSIVKKKKIRDVKLYKTYKPGLTNFHIKFVDKTIINKI
jgi:hypothetical protein